MAAVPTALIAFAYLVSSRPGERRRALGEVIIIGAIGAWAWALVFGYFLSRGHGQAFIDAVFTYNRYYQAASGRI